LQSCQDHLGRPWEADAEEIFGDYQEKPTFNSRISDWPLSTKETISYYGASGYLDAGCVNKKMKLSVQKSR